MLKISFKDGYNKVMTPKVQFMGASLTQKPSYIDTFEHTSSPVERKTKCSKKNFIEIRPNEFWLKHYNMGFIKHAIQENKGIEKILEEHGLETKIYPKNIDWRLRKHVINTTRTAFRIMKQIDGYSAQDYENIRQACLIHDIGKCLVPDYILEKNGKLDPKEKQIADLHTVLGYELIKNSDLNDEVKELVLDHHKGATELGKIIKVADIYSALREKRAYKKEMDHKTAIIILNKEAQEGKVDKKCVEALDGVFSNLY